jgi:hypothetical protein
MALEKRIVYSVQQRWREGSISCFTWPTDDVVHINNFPDITKSEVTQSSKNPNWRYQVAHGQNATTLFSATRTGLEYRPGSIFLGKWCPSSNRFGYYQYDGDLFVDHSAIWQEPPAASVNIDSKTQDEALVRAIGNARQKQNHFRGGNFLAELKDTIRGLRNPVKGFRDLLDTYHRNARRRVKRALGRRSMPTTRQQFRDLSRGNPDVSRAAQKALSDSWLEANFGWAPLLSDAVDAYHALRRLAARTPLERFFGQSSNFKAPTFVNQTRLHDITNVRFSVRTEEYYEVAFYGAVKLEVDSPTGSALEEMGVRARDFLPAVWEAIPYSFLVDYFSNVGDVIEAVSFPRSDLAWISRTFRNHSMRSTERVAVEEPSSPAYPAANSNKVFSFRPTYVKWDRTYVFRDRYTGSIVPSLRFEIPGSKNWRKWCNIAALARMRTL